MGIRAGQLPTGTVSNTSYMMFTEGDAPKRQDYTSFKAGLVGSTNLATTAPTPKEAINELVQDLLESTGYGIVSGGVVSAQSTPNMTVQVTAAILKTSIGARQTTLTNNSLSIATADATNPRIDIIYVNSSGVLSYLQGTAAASPTAPATPTGGLLQAQINVAANATSITNSNITDMRKMINTTDGLAALLSDVVHQPALNTTNTNVTINATNTTNHIAKNVTDSGGVHGFKIEEGTFSPTITGSTTTGSATYSIQKGYYILTGKLCKYEIYMNYSSLGGAVGDVRIGGLPYASKNDAYRMNIDSFVSPSFGFGSNTQIMPVHGDNSNYITLNRMGGTVSYATEQISEIATSGWFILSGTYKIVG